MTAPFVIPFNFQPESVSVETGSYTVPAGKYARVTVNLEGSATFTIGGATALRGTQNTVLASDNLRISDASFPTGAGTLSADTIGAADLGAAGGAFSESTRQVTVVQSYFLPTGTLINGTGTWRAVIEIYNSIT